MILLSRLVVTILLCASFLLAQQSGNKAEISGTVVDPKAAAVANADVVVRNINTGLQREMKSNEAGQFRFPALDTGTYELTAKSAGFETAKLDNIQLTVGSSVSLEVALGLQATSQSVDVSDTLISLTTSAPQTAIGSAQIQNLPINGRRFQDFATLTPTVQVDPQRGQLSIAGQRGVNTNVMMDGSDYSQPFFGGIRGGERSNLSITIPQAAIQEFQVVAGGYNAEYGRSTGGIVNAITRSGTNGIHGEGFWQYRPKGLGELFPIPLNVPGQGLQRLASAENLYQYGGGIGGPIKKDKIFFFAAAERQQANQNRTVQFVNLPTAATPQTQEAFDFFRSQEGPFTSTNNAWAYTLKGDMQSEKGHRLSLRYNQSKNRAENGATVGSTPAPIVAISLTNEGTEGNSTRTGIAQYTHVFSPTLISDLRFSGQYEDRPRQANALLPTVNGGSGANQVGVFGSRNFLPTTQNDLRWQILNATSWTKGNHTIKLGFDAARIQASQRFGFNQFGTFSIGGTSGGNIPLTLDILSTSGGSAAQVLNRFDNADVTYQRQIGNLLADLTSTQFALFAQDSWRVNSKLTLDYGFRWEGQYNPEAEATNTALVDRIRNVTFPTGFRLDPSRIPDATRQFMPRFGFAYSPFSGSRKFVVRGNAGIFHAFTPLLWFAGPNNNFRSTPGDVSITLNSNNPNRLTVYQQLRAAGVDLNSTGINNLPIIPVQNVINAAAAALGSAPDPFNNVSVTSMANDFKNPRSYQLGLGVDGEVARNLVIGFQYQQVNTVNLGRNREWNMPFPVTRAIDGREIFGLVARTVAPGQTFSQLRPIRNLTQVTVRESSGRGLYRAGIFQAQYRAKRFQVGAFYTLSENFSDSDTERDAGGVEYVNFYNLRQEYNYSSLDVRHNFVANGLVTLPFGFEASTIMRIRSGSPFTPTTGADDNGDQITNDRAYQAVGVPFLRNSFRNRGTKNVDLRLMKGFTFKDRFKAQASAEFFNFFNWDNVVYGGQAFNYGVGINQTTGAVEAPLANFMRLRTADGQYFTQNRVVGNPRQIQLGLRFFF
jgi:hypothetical protein